MNSTSPANIFSIQNILPSSPAFSRLFSNARNIGGLPATTLRLISFSNLFFLGLFCCIAYTIYRGLQGRVSLYSVTEKSTPASTNRPLISDQAQRVDHIGAGVLPYFINDDGTAYLLLAKEAAGPAQGQWCDLGGRKDRGECVIETAAREGWEESRDLLGDRESILSAISANDPIGLGAPKNRYGMFFLKVSNPAEVSNEAFKAKNFSSWSRMEKTDIAWVKANDVFNAVVRPKQKTVNGKTILENTIQINEKTELLRGCFAATLYHALKNRDNKEEKEMISKLFGPQIGACSD